MLHRAEVIHLHAPGHHDHTPGVLAGGALHAGAAQGQALHLRVVEGPAPLLGEGLYVAEGRLFRHGGDGARLEHVVPPEKLLGKPVGAALLLAGEVQVDVRHLVPVKAQKGLKGDGVAVPVHGDVAVGAVLGGQVKARVHAAVGDELAVLALGAHIVGLQRVDLRDARHAGHKGGPHGPPGAY